MLLCAAATWSLKYAYLENLFPQSSQMSSFSSWMSLMCELSVPLVKVLYSHRSHLYLICFSGVVCSSNLCLFSDCKLVKDFLQSLHENISLSAWWVFMCVRRWVGWVKPLLQTVHKYGLNPKWTASWCHFSLWLNGAAKGQSSHLYFFSCKFEWTRMTWLFMYLSWFTVTY